MCPGLGPLSSHTLSLLLGTQTPPQFLFGSFKSSQTSLIKLRGEEEGSEEEENENSQIKLAAPASAGLGVPCGSGSCQGFQPGVHFSLTINSGNGKSCLRMHGSGSNNERVIFPNAGRGFPRFTRSGRKGEGRYSIRERGKGPHTPKSQMPKTKGQSQRSLQCLSEGVGLCPTQTEGWLQPWFLPFPTG